MPDLPITNCAAIVGLICPDVAEAGTKAQRLVDDGADAIMVSLSEQQQQAADAVERSIAVFTDLPSDWVSRARTIDGDLDQRGSAATAACVALAEGSTFLVTADVATVRRVRDMFNHLHHAQPEEPT